VPDWPAALAADLRDAECNGTIAQLRQDWQAHIEVGKFLARGLLKVSDSRLPTDKDSLRNVFHETIELMYTLLTGMAAIGLHLLVTNE
jgi:hypothetical protein